MTVRRAYCIADHLNERDWKAYVCPKHLTLEQRRRVIRAIRLSVIVMQTARHPCNRPANYLDIPVVDHPLFFRAGENGYLAKELSEWAERIAALLDDAPLRQRLAAEARTDLLARLATIEPATHVDAVLRRVTREATPPAKRAPAKRAMSQKNV